MTAGIRRAGTASLDLAYVACGRLDGFWEYGLKTWDMAAGALLVKEAGGIISSITGDNDYLTGGDVLCANSKIYQQMHELLNR